MKNLMKFASFGLLAFGLSSGIALAAGKKAPAKKPATPAATEAPAAAPASAPASTPATAETTAPRKKYKTAYGMAGCGLGSLVITDNSTWPQVGAWFLNMTGYQTSAITTGTSNCTDAPPEEARKAEQETFVQVNLPVLSKEAAQGSGETLTALAELFGCSEGEGYSAFAQMSSSRYSAIFSGSQASAVVNNYRREIGSNPSLAGACGRAG